MLFYLHLQTDKGSLCVGKKVFFFFFFSEKKGEKRIVSLAPRLLQLRSLVQQVTKLNDTTVNGVYNYGCWCGPRGEGKIVDNFD